VALRKTTSWREKFFVAKADDGAPLKIIRDGNQEAQTADTRVNNYDTLREEA